jgi:hypothetical protein
LISRGQTWFELALKNPDDLADYPEHLSDEQCEFEGIAYIAAKVYEGKYGKYRYPDIGPYGEIKGTDWEEDEEVFKTRWPRLYAKHIGDRK